MNSIWADFENNEVLNVKNKELFYYFNWDPPYYSTTTNYLLTARDGQCYAWCSFLIDLLKIQGIDQTNDGVLISSSSQGHFLVKNWTTLENPMEYYPSNTDCELENSYTAIVFGGGPGFVISNVGDTYFYEFLYSEIKDGYGGSGQSTGDPASWFIEHCLVYLDFAGKYFDPSYGKTYNSIEDFKNQAIDLFACTSHSFTEQLYQDADPNNNFLPNYDFNGNGYLDEVELTREFRFYKDLDQFDLITETFDR